MYIFITSSREEQPSTVSQVARLDYYIAYILSNHELSFDKFRQEKLLNHDKLLTVKYILRWL